MRSFRYERPRSLAEATRLLAEVGPSARLLAGGTDLVVGLRDGSVAADVVIDLKRVPELGGDPIHQAGEVMTFGALAVMGTIERDDGVLRHLPALAEAARTVGSVQIRNRATLAGNICNGSPAADTTPPLLVYGASVRIAGPGGERRMALDDFILGPGTVALEPGELVSAIDVPIPPTPFGAAYTRLVRRRGTDLASVTLCASVDGQQRAQLAYGSVGPRAFLAADESGVLADSSTDGDRWDAVLTEMLGRATPSERSVRAGPDYRLAMLRVLSRRALEVAMARRAGVAS